MNQSIAKIVGVVVLAGSLVGAYELGRRTVSSDAEDAASPTERYGDDHYGVEIESSSESTEGGGDLAPLETLTTDPSLPYVSFVDPSNGQGVRTLVVVGAPGIWPPATRTSGPRGGLYLPDTDVKTLRGRNFHHFELMARSASRSLAYWGEVEFEQPASPEAWPQKQVRMEPASSVAVRVIGPDGRPVSGAKVRLSRRRIGFVSLTKRAGPEGNAQFRTVPAGTYVASAHVDGTGRNRTEFEHEATGTSKLTLRLESRPEPETSVAESSSTTSTPSQSPRAEPREVAVRVDGLDERQWRSSALHWRRAGGEWQLGTLRHGSESGSRRWRQRLRPGTYQLRVLHDGGGETRRTIEVDGGDNQFSWTITFERDLRLYVQDASGGPVEGALVQVWREGALVESAMSQGTDPVVVSLDTESTFEVVAIDARRGEASRTVEPGSAQRELIVSLDRPLFSVDRPPGRIRQPERIEEILGVPLVRDNQSWLIDVQGSDSAAARAGLERADRLMSLHQIGGNRWEAIVERDGQIIETDIR